MVRARPQWNTDGASKTRHYDQEQWEALNARLRSRLRPFYPDKDAKEDEDFGHRADGWANGLVSEAKRAISTVLWQSRRPTNEQLRAERAALLATLEKAVEQLSKVSHDLDILFGVDADVLGTRDKIRALLPSIQASGDKIASLPKAMNIKDAQNAAAVEMAVRVLHAFKGVGGKISATADPDLDRSSDAVSILKILGDELGLPLTEVTWKRVIGKARKSSPRL